MREEVEEPNWFARWEDELPTPEELTPLSQSLITPDLALAFDIPTPTTTTTTTTTNNNNNNNNNSTTHPPPLSSLHVNHHLGHLNHHLPPPPTHQSPDFDSADLASSGGGSGNNGGGDEPARTLKRPRLVWTPQLHKRFVDAVAHLGIKNAVPKTIMQLMSVDGLTRENVASHLQKYRLYLKRMQGLSTGGGGGAGTGGPISAADAATDQLFASGPLPHHFLGRGGVGGVPPAVGGATEPPSFLPYMPVAALQHHHQQMAVAAAAAAQQQYYHQRQHGGLFARGGPGLQMQPGLGRAGPGLHSIMQQQQQQQMGTVGDLDDLEEGGRGGGRKVLTLFPTGED